MQRKFKFSNGEYYHIYNRGTEKRSIFEDDHDRNRFLALLYACNNNTPVDISRHYDEGRSFVNIFQTPRTKSLVSIGAYALMPNHFHLLLRQKTDDGASTFARKLLSGFSTYFNRRHNRTGVLFEGRYKAEHVDTDDYLRYLFAYIHLNPIALVEPAWKEKRIKDKRGAKNFLRTYAHSSYLEYCGIQRSQSTILKREDFPEYFESSKDFDAYLNEFLNLAEGRSFVFDES